MKKTITPFFAVVILLSVATLSTLNSCKQNTKPKEETATEETNTVLVRQNIYTLGSNSQMVASYRKGVEVMKTKPATDPTSWAYQAAIHGTYSTPAQPIWNQCQHGSYYFLSWHRMYLYYFEKIVRKSSGDPNFALPYWNYSDVPAQAVMPDEFRQPADASNTFYVAQRNPSINNGAALPPSVVSYSVAFGYTNFLAPTGSGLGFGGQIIPAPAHFTGPPGRIESQPHNIVHSTIGGWMGDPNTAAQDPIFWLHHSNIDRLWEKWLELGDGRSNPTDNDVWMNTPFTFYDADKEAFVTIMGKDILKTAAQLDYTYDDVPLTSYKKRDIKAFATVESLIDTSKVKTTLLASKQKIDVKGFKTPIALTSAPKFKALTEKLAPLQENEFSETKKRFILNLDGVTYDTLGDGAYEVYINLPNNITDPDINSAYYVGTMGMFGFKGGHMHAAHNHNSEQQGGMLEYDITEQVSRLKSTDELKNINVTIFFRALLAPGAERENVAIPVTKLTIANVALKQVEF